MSALEGIRVLDLTRLLPGPYGSMYLSDFGAEVIKIESPGEGDYARTYAPLLKGLGYRFLITNRGKKSLSLNLKTDEGREIFKKLAEESDVVMEGFRPGVMEKLGIGYEDLKAINPGIIVCSISGYGRSGPYRQDPGHDLNYISIAGIPSLTGEKGGAPMIPGVQIADLTAGLFAVMGILMALQERGRTGLGQFVDVSLFASAMSMLAADASTYFGSGKVPLRGEERLTGGWPHYNIYRARDGRYLSCGALEKKFFQNLCNALGCAELVDGMDDPKNRDNIKRVLTDKFSEKTAAEWEEYLKGKDTCVTVVKTLDETFSDPHVLENELVFNVEDETLGSHRQLGFPVKLSRTPAQYTRRAPYLGEQTNELLTGLLGFTPAQIKELSEKNVI